MRGLIAGVSSWSWAELGSRMAGFMFVWAIIQQLFPHRFRVYIGQLSDRLIAALDPYMQITIHEYSSNGRSNEVYAAAKAYLGSKSSNQQQAKCLQAEMVKNNKSFLISLDTSEEVTDDFFNGGGTINLWWALREKTVSKKSFSLFPSASEEFQKMYYKLTFHRRYKDIITGPYLQHVVQEGKAIEHRNRQRKLYTNSWRGYWSPIVFEHPATFQTLAMDAKRKEEIMDDLVTFSKGGEYYSKVGKAWKRGYLLYGPPGTGKSTMIAAIANFLSYDVYDLELTSVRSNTELRQLLIDTKSKSVIVIEDIDCSLDLTCKRKSSENSSDSVEDSIKKETGEEGGGGSRVTLSGLLNFIDGIWSACGAERMIVFTTNHVDKLDPALIRRGRMDMHIEMSYCKFEAFKVLAKNYLDIESHALFGTIERLLEESSMSPCDVAESLIQKTAARDVEACLNDLIGALNRAKKNASLKAGKEAELRPKENSRWMKKIGGKLKKQIN